LKDLTDISKDVLNDVARILNIGGEVKGKKSNVNSQKVTIFVKKKPNISIH